MSASGSLSRVLGVAFSLEFVTSLANGTVLKPMWFAAGEMVATLVRIVERSLLMRGYVLVDVVTALGWRSCAGCCTWSCGGKASASR